MDKKEISKQKQREHERRSQIKALQEIRDNHNAAPGERLEAIKLLMELEKI